MSDRYDIESIKSRIDSLPLIDVTVLELLSLLNDQDSSFQQIIDNISPEITARFIKMANTAYYWTNVRSIDYAVRVWDTSYLDTIYQNSQESDMLTNIKANSHSA